jgi:hypothetical protein
VELIETYIDLEEELEEFESAFEQDEIFKRMMKTTFVHFHEF